MLRVWLCEVGDNVRVAFIVNERIALGDDMIDRRPGDTARDDEMVGYGRGGALREGDKRLVGCDDGLGDDCEVDEAEEVETGEKGTIWLDLWVASCERKTEKASLWAD